MFTEHSMNESNKLLSDIVAFRTYAKYLPHANRRETLEESINRYMVMHLDRFPKLSKDILKAMEKVHALQVMPSMRGLQFAGDAVLKNNARLYNCCYLPINEPNCFGELLFLALSGVGNGFSVQNRHISQLPKIQLPREEGIFFVHDSIQGWAQALQLLIDAYFYGRIRPQFNFSNIRPKGSYLVTTGAKAPGPEPLRYMLEQVESKLKLALGRKLKSIEVYDIICLASDSVVSGGVRRSALIALFDRDDMDMLKAKSGDWWIKHPYRARANNSAILPRSEVNKEEFLHVFKMGKDSKAGEPGVSWSNNPDSGYNPCVTGDTEILTKSGYRKIESLIGKELEIWNGFEWSKVTPKITGYNQKIVKITFNTGQELKCTLYHKFHIAKGYTGKVEVVEAKDLKVKDKLIKHSFPLLEISQDNLNNAYLQGFYSAEGTENYSSLYVYYPKRPCLPKLKDYCLSISHEPNNKRYRLKFDKALMPKNFVPINYSQKSKLEWLSGLFDGDGTELKEGGLQLTSIDKTFLLNLQKLLHTLGTSSKIVHAQHEGYRKLPDGRGSSKDFYCKQSYRICIGAIQIQELKSLGLDCQRLKFNKKPQRDASQFVTIKSIEEVGTEEVVYCFNEPKRHLGVFNGVITGQCHEASLDPFEFCNLTTVNQTGIKDKKDFLSRVYAATLLGTLQASYTDFPYLSAKWKETTERDALLGVSFTGIADANNIITAEWLQEASKLALEVNEKYSKKLGINLAARLGVIKPEGSSSAVLGSSSGIHARHSLYYLRRVRMSKNDALASYLSHNIPELVEDDTNAANGIVITLPQQSPSGAIIRTNESALSLFSRALMYNQNWCHATHRRGDNPHNVSVTISVKDYEWDSLAEAMWEQRELYSGISLLPYDGGTYKQAPFEECSEEIFEAYSRLVKNIDLKQVVEIEDTTERTELVACAGGLCEV